MKRTLTLLLSLLILSPCYAQVKEESVVAAIDAVTELRLGRFWVEQALKEKVISKNASYQQLVQRIADRILRSINDRPDLDEWTFTVVQESQPNAFAFPGGQILVTTGAIEITMKDGVADEEMLASVIGHEIAHATLRHSIKGMQTAGSLKWVMEHLNKQDKDKKPDNEDLQRLEELARARFTRIQEFEADAYGAFYAAVAGYNYSGGIRYSQLMIDKGYEFEMQAYWLPRKNGTELKFADHPTEVERIQHLKTFQDTLMNIAAEFDWGFEMLKTRNYDKAIRCFKDVTLKYPMSYQAWNNLGKAYHMKYLEQQDPQKEKFQVDLADYFVSLREKLRDARLLQQALDCYRKAYNINPNEPGIKNNIAVALAQTGREEDLEEAEDILTRLLKRNPTSARYANHMAIVLYKKGEKEKAEVLFDQADAELPAAGYNLAVMQLESGKQEQALSGFNRYLQTDSNSGWAEFARQTLARHKQTPPAQSSSLQIQALFGLLPGTRREEVTKALGDPEKAEKVSTSAGDNGQRFWYRSLGLDVVLLEGRVQSINLVQIDPASLQNVPDIRSLAPPQPEFLGVQIGDGEKELLDRFGTQLIPGDTSRKTGKVYSYTDGKRKVEFLVYLSKVMGISIQNL